MRKWTLKQWIGSVIIITGILIMTVLFIRQEIVLGLIIAMIPLVTIILFIAFDNPYWGLIILFAENYFIMGITRYVNISGLGILTDVLILFIFVSMLFRTIFNKDIDWKRYKNGAVLLFFIWFIYCILELTNPTANKSAWFSSFRSLSFYPLSVIILTSILFTHYNDFKRILIIYAVFSMLAVAKMFMQKTFGFDSAEWNWLNQGSNRDTHLLYSGIRYFSFFTDAGNFGSNMGCVMVVFLICSLFTKKKVLQIIFGITGVAGMIAMFMSGTRGAIAVPLAGFILFTILSKKIKIFFISMILILSIFSIFMFTDIGQDNQYVRRMRTAFDPNEPSLIVRLENQKKLATYMKNKPFGEGIGLSGVEARRFDPGRLTTNIPNDSWYVKIWVETGIIGLIIYLSILFITIGYSAYIIFFKIKNSELKSYLIAVTCGIFGLMASAYGNPFFGQYPTCILVSMIQAFIFISPLYDKEIETYKITPAYYDNRKLE
jgi:hypothetical protein